MSRACCERLDRPFGSCGNCGCRSRTILRRRGHPSRSWRLKQPLQGLRKAKITEELKNSLEGTQRDEKLVSVERERETRKQRSYRRTKWYWQSSKSYMQGMVWVTNRYETRIDTRCWSCVRGLNVIWYANNLEFHQPLSYRRAEFGSRSRNLKHRACAVFLDVSRCF